MSKLAIAGISVTALHLIALALIIGFSIKDFQSLRPNEWGDFIAGSLGPLAIFWLILGYFQQGRELQNSVKALSLQTKELEASVVQQRNLVQASREAIEIDEIQRRENEYKRKSGLQPNLTFEIFTQPHLGENQLHINIRNYGRPIINAEFHLMDGDKVQKYWSEESIEFNKEMRYKFSMKNLLDRYNIDVKYRDLDGDSFSKLIKIIKRDDVAYDWSEIRKDAAAYATTP